MKFTNAELTARMISDQKNGWPFCPRCGKPLKIDPQTQRAASSNALSREVSGLYICDDCGSDEALRAFAGLPLPLEEWDQTSTLRIMPSFSSIIRKTAQVIYTITMPPFVPIGVSPKIS